MFLITSVIYVIKGEYVMENEERIEKFLLLSERNRREILSALPQERQISKLADYFQNFSDSTRIKILTCLSMMNMCVNDLSTILGINQTTISHQLKQLKDQNLVAYRREGKILVYYLTNESVNDMMMYALDSHVI
jgi:ArsR family transcriptional regulator